MMKWIIATYIILVLGFSAKARAISLESNPALNKLNHSAKGSQQLEVQDPLPETSFETLNRMDFDSVSENFVG